jgi:uncharacterized protein
MLLKVHIYKPFRSSMSEKIVSVSRIPILITINNVIDLEGELVRHLSPLTIKRIISRLPITNLVNNFQNNFIQIKFELDIGIEKPKTIFKKGDIAFSPISNNLCIFLNNFVHNQQLNLVGFIKEDGTNELLKTKAGDFISIRKI